MPPGGDVAGVIEKAEDHKLPIEQAVKIATETCLGLVSLRRTRPSRNGVVTEPHIQ